MSVSDKYSAGLLPFWHFDFGFGQGNIALTAWLTMAISQGFLIGEERRALVMCQETR